MKNYSKEINHLRRLMRELESEIPNASLTCNDMARNNAMEGVLAPKTKALIALGMAITSKNDALMAIHIQKALRKKVTKCEIAEVISISLMMSAEPMLLAACKATEMLSALEQVETPARLFDH